MRNLQEQVKKASCFKNCTELSLFEWIGLVVWKMFVILGLSTSKVYPWSLEHFFLRKVRTILEFWNTVRFFDCGFFSVLKVGKLFCLTLRIIFLTASKRNKYPMLSFLRGQKNCCLIGPRKFAIMILCLWHFLMDRNNYIHNFWLNYFMITVV